MTCLAACGKNSDLSALKGQCFKTKAGSYATVSLALTPEGKAGALQRSARVCRQPSGFQWGMALNGAPRMLRAVCRAEGVLQNLGCAEEECDPISDRENRDMG